MNPRNSVVEFRYMVLFFLPFFGFLLRSVCDVDQVYFSSWGSGMGAYTPSKVWRGSSMESLFVGGPGIQMNTNGFGGSRFFDEGAARLIYRLTGAVLLVENLGNRLR